MVYSLLSNIVETPSSKEPRAAKVGIQRYGYGGGTYRAVFLPKKIFLEIFLTLTLIVLGTKQLKCKVLRRHSGTAVLRGVHQISPTCRDVLFCNMIRSVPTINNVNTTTVVADGLVQGGCNLFTLEGRFLGDV